MLRKEIVQTTEGKAYRKDYFLLQVRTNARSVLVFEKCPSFVGQFYVVPQ